MASMFSSSRNNAALIDAKFVTTGQKELRVEEKVGVFSSDLTVYDASGAKCFSQRCERTMGVLQQRKLLDANGAVCATIRVKPLSINGTWQLYRGDGAAEHRHVCDVAVKSSGNKNMSRVLFGKSSGRSEMYLLDSARQITLYEKARSKDKVLAVVSRRPLLGNAPASPPAKGTCEYHVVVQPGVDIAFVLALVSVVDCSAVARTAQPAAPAVPVKRAVGVAA